LATMLFAADKEVRNWAGMQTLLTIPRVLF
jgi:hypothetical protein